MSDLREALIKDDHQRDNGIVIDGADDVEKHILMKKFGLEPNDIIEVTGLFNDTLSSLLSHYCLFYSHKRMHHEWYHMYPTWRLISVVTSNE
jgi:hypothetical protein